jgi:hypothetical protein
MKQLSLFPPPEPPPLAGSAFLDFDIILKNGDKVSVHYERRYFRYSACLEFRGGSISSTEYYCFFPSGERLMNDPDDVVIDSARNIAERLYEERVAEIAKDKRKRKRSK